MTFEEQLEKLRSSRQFHARWYLETYPQVKAAGADPVEHYLREGAAQGHNPGKFFDTRLYLSRYPDVTASGLNPLVHYELVGAAEGRAINAKAADRQDQATRKADAEARRKQDQAAERQAQEARKATAALHKQAVDAARKAAAEEVRKLTAGLKPAAAPPPSPPQAPHTRGTALDKLTDKARAAAKKGDWLAASRHWQDALALPAEPYVGLSEAAAAMGDLARAEEILRDGLARFEANPMLLEAYCRLAQQARRWPEVVARWEMIAASGCIPDPKLQAAVAEAFIVAGDCARAQALLDEVRPRLHGSTQLARFDALLAEAQGDWAQAADIWLARARKSKDVAQVNSYLRGVRALLQAGDMDRAEDEAQALVRKFAREIAFLKLHTEVAIAQDAWAVALERWQRVETLERAEAGAMPPEWIHRIGVDAARARTEAIRIGRLRATGMLALATTVQPVDEAGALLLARRARKFYGEEVSAMVAQLLSDNTRHSASIWWMRRLIARSRTPKRHYPLLVEALIASSRLDDCAAVLSGYADRYGQDNLWLRGMVEIHYRRGDFAAMRDVMQVATGKKLKIGFTSVRVLRWLYDLIRLHPAPQDFLPAEIHDLALRTAALYDGRFLADAIAMLLDPARGDAVAEDRRAQIAAAADGTQEIAPLVREDLLQFFSRRRDWEQVQALLDLPFPQDLDPAIARKVWNIVRNKIDFRLGQGDVAGAEAVACGFLDQLAAQGLDGFALAQATGFLFRLPLSGAVVDRLLACAQRLGFSQMVARLTDWQARHVGFDPAPVLGCAPRARCFIVGNAPSIADMPLHLLAGEDIFCVNRGMRARDVGLPQPKYLVVADPHVYKSHAREIDADGASVEGFFMASNCLWRKPPTVPVIPVGTSGLKLSLAPFRHAPGHLHRGDTVVVLAAQIAHLMGYREIYIIGVDLDYGGPVTHFYGGGRKETERLANFRPGGSGTEMVNLAFANLQDLVAADGCRLFNASPAGSLDALERVDFVQLLSGEGGEGSTTAAPTLQLLHQVAR